MPTDNTVVSAFEALVQVGRQNKLPVIAGDINTVPRGAIAATGFDYLDVGRQTGRMVARVLRGDKPGDIQVEYAQTLELERSIPPQRRPWASRSRGLGGAGGYRGEVGRSAR